LRKSISLAFLDNAVSGVYGVGYIALVLRTLPQAEFGLLVLARTAQGFAQMIWDSSSSEALVKYVAQETGPVRGVIVRTALLVRLALALAMGLVILAAAPLACRILSQPALLPLLRLLPLLIITSFVSSLACSLLQADRKMGRILAINTAGIATTLALLVAGRLFGAIRTAREIILIGAAADVVASVVAVALAHRVLSLSGRFDLSWFVRIIHFGKYSFMNAVQYTAYTRVDLLILARLGSLHAVAAYGLCREIYRFAGMLGSGFQRVVVPAASSLGSRESVRELCRRQSGAHMLLMIPVGVSILLLAPWIISIAGGGAYPEAAPLLRIFGILVLMQPFGKVLASGMVGMGMLGWLFVIGSTTMVLNVVLDLILIPPYGAMGAALGTMSAQLIGAAALVHRGRRSLGLPPWAPLYEAKRILAGVLAVRPARSPGLLERVER
jgi:O-antigen/teichoic acid export membrane protein